MDLSDGSNKELQEIIDKLASHFSKYGIEIIIEKSKVMVNRNDKNLQADIYCSKLEEVEQCIYLGATLTKAEHVIEN